MAAGNGYMQYLLSIVASQGAIVSVYMDPNHPDDFFSGFLEHVGPRHFLMADITPWGRMDGWRVLRTTSALQMLLGEDFEQRLSLLLAHYGEKHTPFFDAPLREEDDILYRVLEKCCAEKRVISLVVGEDMITGRVSEVNELRMKIDALSFFGENAGVEQLTLREIDMVCIGTGEEEMYETLERISGGAQLRVLRQESPEDKE